MTSVVILLLGVALGVALMLQSNSSRDEAKQTSDAIAHAPEGSMLAVLGKVAVRGRAPKTGYSRAEFGPAWADTDHNGCDTRNDILRRDLTSIRRGAGRTAASSSPGSWPIRTRASGSHSASPRQPRSRSTTSSR